MSESTLERINRELRQSNVRVELRRTAGGLRFVGEDVPAGADGLVCRDGIPLRRLGTLWPGEWVTEGRRLATRSEPCA